eukprot:CAMPEP_0114270334 /NCGR_PEP_ID=MMETSP0058-20121206/27179_1 /TAXON_ID=36894 /ORGANISM="Pyramimonas parkeae, CCMP726" /LENGTH=298 /DNA_ID=CAMNT_0001389057 /DNA_START=257 /DNA_END=1153 /DNA_ORIENTATION=-
MGKLGQEALLCQRRWHILWGYDSAVSIDGDQDATHGPARSPSGDVRSAADGPRGASGERPAWFVPGIRHGASKRHSRPRDVFGDTGADKGGDEQKHGASGTVSGYARMGRQLCRGCQTIVVPVDVISQRLMVQDGSKKLSNSALSMAQSILQKEGVRGLYRGFAASLVTVTPSSAIWWGSYGFYTKMMWEMFSTDRDFEGPVDTSKVAGLQVVSGLCAGLTSGLLTNPLDVIKTRLQVSQTGTDGKRPTLKGTVQELVSNHGIMGFTRGLVPRMANTALWGTCMVCAYEFLKRLSVRQ